MRGAEQRPGQPRPIGQPVFQQFEPGGTGTPGIGSGEQRSAINGIRGLIERRRRLNIPDVDEYVMKWKGLTAFHAELGIETTPEVHQMIVNVSRGLDFVLFEKIKPAQRGSILEELQNARQKGIEQYVLTHEEGLLLRDAAAAVNVPYDPGTPDEVEKRTFKIADLEQKAQGLQIWDW